MFNKTDAIKPIDQATIDHYVAKGSRERSRAFANMVRSLFSKPEPKAKPAKPAKAVCA